MQVGIQDGDSHICHFDGCTEMDLLSARCSNCGKMFCSQHLNGSAHNCACAKDERIPSCPLCLKAVRLEYPQQSPDEAVSRHMDRGCRDPPMQSTTTASTRAQAPAHPLLAKLFPGGGQRLGGSHTTQSDKTNRCSVPGCGRNEDVRIVCDLCGKVYCIAHRSVGTHNCPGRRLTPTPQPVMSSSEAARKASPSSGAGTSGNKSGPASVAALLSHPRNTPKTALGKPSESALDMSTPLVCLLVPARDQRGGYASIPSFFYHVNKNWSVGRMVDALVDTASQSSSVVNTSTPWQAFVVPVPMPTTATSHMYPAIPLSTVVRHSALGTAQSSIVFVSALSGESLPEEAVKAASEAQRGTTKSGSDESCTVM